MECVRCGANNSLTATTCGRCTWPLAWSGWSSTTVRIKRITLDTGCINLKQKNDDLNTLERWAGEGRLELQRSPAMLQELTGDARVAKAQTLEPQPSLFTLGVSALGGGDVLAGPDLPQELKQILFPTAASLTDNQRQDVEHLRLHVRTGGHVFVTLNPNDFITRGRQDTLASFGVWVMSPQQMVQLLRQLYRWA